MEKFDNEQATLGWELGGGQGFRVETGTGDLYMEMFYNEQTTL